MTKRPVKNSLAGDQGLGLSGDVSERFFELFDRFDSPCKPIPPKFRGRSIRNPLFYSVF